MEVIVDTPSSSWRPSQRERLHVDHQHKHGDLGRKAGQCEGKEMRFDS